MGACACREFSPGFTAFYRAFLSRHFSVRFRPGVFQSARAHARAHLPTHSCPHAHLRTHARTRSARAHTHTRVPVGLMGRAGRGGAARECTHKRARTRTPTPGRANRQAAATPPAALPFLSPPSPTSLCPAISDIIMAIIVVVVIIIYHYAHLVESTATTIVIMPRRRSRASRRGPPAPPPFIEYL